MEIERHSPDEEKDFLEVDDGYGVYTFTIIGEDKVRIATMGGRRKEEYNDNETFPSEVVDAVESEGWTVV